MKLIVLHDPDDKEPPSAQTTLDYLVRVGKRLDTQILLRTLKNIDLNEGDALFIRQTTEIGNGTYYWAKKAEALGMPVIDDPRSIEICTDKVETYYRFLEAGVAQPETIILRDGDIEAYGDITFPAVVKEPDSCFSRGVFKVNNTEELVNCPAKGSELVVQEFLPTTFDWRVGVLNEEVLFVAKYFMPKGHWQIVKRYPSGHAHLSKYEIWSPGSWPEPVCELALQAAACVGNGLYGVDIKDTHKGLVIIEINDNPSIDSDAEGKYGVWKRIIERFKEMCDGRKNEGRKHPNRQQDNIRDNRADAG